MFGPCSWPGTGDRMGRGKPHDWLFKWAFGGGRGARCARALLRAVLPPRSARALGRRLRPAPGEAVNAALTPTRSDVLHEGALRGRRALFLLEHKSAREALLAWQGVRYGVRAVEADRAGGGAGAGQRVTPVVLVALVHARSRWRRRRRLSELLDLDPDLCEELRPGLVDGGLIYDDLRDRTDAELLGRRMPAEGRAALVLLKRGRRSEDVAEVLWAIAEPLGVLRRREGARRRGGAVEALMSYVVLIWGTGDEVRRAMGEAIGSGRADEILNLREIGRKEGRDEGRDETARRILLELLEQRFGPLSAAQVRRVEEAPLAAVERGIPRVYPAKRFDEVLPRRRRAGSRRRG